MESRAADGVSLADWLVVLRARDPDRLGCRPLHGPLLLGVLSRWAVRDVHGHGRASRVGRYRRAFRGARFRLASLPLSNRIASTSQSDRRLLAQNVLTFATTPSDGK